MTRAAPYCYALPNAVQHGMMEDMGTQSNVPVEVKMKIGVISDIHSNIIAFRAAVA